MWQEQQAQRREELRDVIEEGRKRKREKKMQKVAESSDVQRAEKECDAAMERLTGEHEKGDNNDSESRGDSRIEKETALRIIETSGGIRCSSEPHEKGNWKGIDKENEMITEHGITGPTESLREKLGNNEEAEERMEEQDENGHRKDTVEYDGVIRMPVDSTAESKGEHVDSCPGNLQRDDSVCRTGEHDEMTGPNQMEDAVQWDRPSGREPVVSAERQDERKEGNELMVLEVTQAQTKKDDATENDNQTKHLNKDTVLPKESKDDRLPCTSECSAGAEETEDKQQKSCEASDGNVKDGGCSVQLFTGNCIE